MASNENSEPTKTEETPVVEDTGNHEGSFRARMLSRLDDYTSDECVHHCANKDLMNQISKFNKVYGSKGDE